MAASDNGNSRRQRRRGQLKPPEIARKAAKSGLSKRQVNPLSPPPYRGNITPPLPRRIPTNFRQRQWSNREGTSWWEQLFGQTSRRPTPPTRRLQGQKILSLDDISHLAIDRTTQANEFNLADLRSGLTIGQPAIPPFSQIPERGNKRKISPYQNQILPAKNQKKRKSLSMGNSTSGIANPVPHAKLNSASSRKPKQQRRTLSPLLYASRLLILGIGLSVVVGTLLSIWNPATRKSPDNSTTVDSSLSSTNVTGIGLKSSAVLGDNLQTLKLDREIRPLKTAVQSLTSQYPQLSPAIFVLDIDTGAYLDWNSTATLAAASTIKLPILLAFFQDVDSGKIRLDEQLTLEKEDIVSGSGKMQYKPAGTKYTALETVTQMIIASDNSATNMLIQRLGGMQVLNQRFREWGLQATIIQNKLPDIEGTNTTSPKELAILMVRVNQGELVSLTSRDRLLSIMQRTQNRSLLPKGLGKGSTIAHKTGSIGSMLADVGLIDLPSGKRYIAAVMVKRPRNDPQAAESIEKISRLVYQYFSRPTGTPKLPSEDSAIPANSVIPVSKPVERG